MKRNLKIVLLCLALLFTNAAQIQAAEKASQITIAPFLREVKFLAEEGTKNFEVELTNDSDKPQKISLSVLDFGSLNETGGLVFAGSDASSLVKKYGLANWLQLSATTLNIDAGKSAKIQASIINDFSLTPGGHYAAIVASIEAETGADSNQINVNQKLSSLIFATKQGGEKYDLHLDEIDASSSRFNLPGFVTLHFSNPGNVHVVPRGTVKILAPGGEVVSQGTINEESSFVLPETSRQMLVKLSTIGRKDLRVSAYKLRVDYRYDGIEQFARKEQPIYITSIIGIIPLAILIVAIALVSLKLGLHRFIHKSIRNILKRKH